MKKYTVIYFLLCSISVIAQSTNSTSGHESYSGINNLTLGGYGQFDYNQKIDNNTIYNGTLDIHRIVLLLGYRFNQKTQLVTEFEYEHVKEVFVEQAYLQYEINNFINFKGGLLLIPMGIINEYHEPPTFNGVERPIIDSKIAPSTWRELGAGFNGNLINASVKYELYLVNGFTSYNGKATLSGSNGFRKGRQKGAESIVYHPNLSSRISYYGLTNLNVGLSFYSGKTQSSLYDGINKNDQEAIQLADSSVVGLNMTGIDARYNKSGFEAKAQMYYATISNTDQYNEFTATNGKLNDLGSAMLGIYTEVAYNIFQPFDEFKTSLIPFFRYEYYNMHNSVENTITANKAYRNNVVTSGIGWKITSQSMLKADMQFIKSAASATYEKTFNAGIAVMF